MVQEGNADLEVISQTKKGFSGTLTFTTGHGTEFSANYHTTISNRLKFTFNFKSRDTSLKISGSLQQIAVILCSLSGKFEGAKLPHLPGLNQMELIGIAFCLEAGAPIPLWRQFSLTGGLQMPMRTAYSQ